jgi:hypothetical protein
MRSERSVHASRWFWLTTVVGGIVGLFVVGAAGQERRQGAATRLAAKPDYNRVFAMDRVHELRIRLTAEQFEQMQRDPSRLGRGRGFARRTAGPHRSAWRRPPRSGSCHGCSGKAVDGECSVVASAPLLEGLMYSVPRPRRTDARQTCGRGAGVQGSGAECCSRVSISSVACGPTCACDTWATRR